MPKWDTVAIVGVGLIGGSIGLALRERKLAARVVGIGRSASSLRQARQRGAVSSTTTDLESGVREAELTIVCTPVETIVGHVRAVAEHCPEGSLITDAGSTKLHIARALAGRPSGRLGRQVHFLGSHPLAGGEKNGPRAAQADLFVDRLVVITPTRYNRAVDVARVVDLWTSLGARVTQMTPQAHDEAVAAISHLPHLVASALAAATQSRHLPLAATGWSDTTRVAAGDVELWRQIFSENRDHVLKSLERFETILASFRQALERNDSKQLLRLLEAGKRNRDSVGS